VDLDIDGVELAANALTAGELAVLTDLFDDVGERPGKRIIGHPAAAVLTDMNSTLGGLAQAKLGPNARPVRLVLFDKTARRNWGVAWHQDRTIAVRERREVEGFGPWSTKQGVLHVTPPFKVLAGMVTMRAHLDPVDDLNAPLIVAKGSHRIGVVAADQASRVAEAFDIATCLADVGQVWIYRTPILHASKPAQNPKRRRVLQIDFASADLPGGLEWAGV